MFKYFINNDTRIILSSGSKKLSFPLHPGMVLLDYRYNFRMNYQRHNFEKVSRLAKRIYEKGITVNYNTQIYRLRGSYINVTIPYTFQKTLQIPENSIVSVCWEDDTDLLSHIKVITSEQAQEIMKEELLHL